MSRTKEQILLTALRLFARDGYEAVSVSQIAGELDMVKSALYRHYQSKRDIFESILQRMETLDAERAGQYEMPEGTFAEMAEKYGSTPLTQMAVYSEAQFDYWTQEEFPTLFRRMLAVEQYRSAEMAQLYQQYLCSGPLGYMADLLGAATGDPARGPQLALEFYAPMFMLYSLYDGAPDEEKPQLKGRLHDHLTRFVERVTPLLKP